MQTKITLSLYQIEIRLIRNNSCNPNMGMTKQEISRKLDEIVDFSGVERFMIID